MLSLGRISAIFGTISGRARHALLGGLLAALAAALPQPLLAATAALEKATFSALPGDRVRITLELSGQFQAPRSFTVDQPARIALDFPETTSALPWRTKDIGLGHAKSVSAIEANGRTRVVINLVKMVGYDTKVEGNKFILTLGTQDEERAPIAAAPVAPAAPVPGAAEQPTPARSGHWVEHVDFRRGDAGEGRVLVTLSDANVIMDVREQGGRIIVDFLNTSLPPELEQRLDVLDFATPVKAVDAVTAEDNARLVIHPVGRYEYLAYQSENTFTVDVKPITAEEQAAAAQQREYEGEKLSLNFQDIEVRAVLQLLADFTGLNIVVSDTVQGSITLRLKNVPWDQALDIILKTKGLAMRQNGNIILIAPGDEIAGREKQELEARKQITELAPLHSELIQINYAKATDLAELLKSDRNTLLSERGNVSVDQRTNTLLVRETAERLVEIRKLVTKLDVPIRQVLIESRIVIANDDFARDIGARFGVTGVTQSGGNVIGTSGTIQGPTGESGGLNTIMQSARSNTTGNLLDLTVPSAMDADAGGAAQRLNINMPVLGGNAGSFALSILRSNTLLDLELSALQVEGRGEVISNPRIITSNQKKARIEQGTEIPYQEATSSGATSVAFKKAVLSLEVTPQITPDDRVILDLTVNKDSRGETFQGVPSIDTKEVNTQVLVDNGQTVVLGGIYEQINRKEKSKVPLLGDIPLLGALFRNTSSQDSKAELLIFVTPKILKENLNLP